MNQNLDASGKSLTPAEREIEKVLRPLEFSDFAGQTGIVDNLKIFVAAAYQRGCLLYTSDAADELLCVDLG